MWSSFESGKWRVLKWKVESFEVESGKVRGCRDVDSSRLFLQSRRLVTSQSRSQIIKNIKQSIQWIEKLNPKKE